MDLFRISKSTFQPIEPMIGGYDSLIWTERFRPAGEFELHTRDIYGTMALLPEMTLLSHRQTKETMMVEDHSIEPHPEGGMKLVVKGRSLDAFAEQRLVPGWLNEKRWLGTFTPGRAALMYIWNWLVNDTGVDATGWSAMLSNGFAVPNTVASRTGNISGESKRRWTEIGNMYPMILECLEEADLGFRTIRPTGSTADVTVVRFGTGSSLGEYISSIRTVPNELRWDVYTGGNRAEGTTNEVVFDDKLGHILNPKYFYSVKTYKNYYFATNTLYGHWNDYPVGLNPIGLDLRAHFIETKDPPDNNGPENPETWARDIGVRRTKKARRTKMLTGEISTESGYEYGKDYFLGDLVTLKGRYGLKETMRVVEHVRTEDRSGDIGTPGLELPI